MLTLKMLHIVSLTASSRALETFISKSILSSFRIKVLLHSNKHPAEQSGLDSEALCR